MTKQQEICVLAGSYCATSINAIHMSRIGNHPIKLPKDVTVTISPEGDVCVSGPKGSLTQHVDAAIIVTLAEETLSLQSKSTQKTQKALHGLYRALLQNMVIGVSEGYKKTLEFVGVGYKVSVQNNVLDMSLGYAHGIYFSLPAEVIAQTEMVKGKNPLVHLESIDKQLLGQVAAKIKSLRKVEPYKGKGIRFLGEKIRRKAGKSTNK